MRPFNIETVRYFKKRINHVSSVISDYYFHYCKRLRVALKSRNPERAKTLKVTSTDKRKRFAGDGECQLFVIQKSFLILIIHINNNLQWCSSF